MQSFPRQEPERSGERPTKRPRTAAPPFFVAVHVGAGVHSRRREAAYLDVMRRALRAAADALNDEHASAVDACTAAICVMEDSPLCNAGLGSNLTSAGTVECDASIMSGARGPGVPEEPSAPSPLSQASRTRSELRHKCFAERPLAR
eukprot:TRINITY_DN22602_c0_g1_i1.p2 TRINITY_DN22602_c0_g1~~TRINITY_DN22602_c0_g1_i1.p2  ORF type:complete len:147 (-),score=28.96 TRINITY_DN22602_c0_g1_i1:326-766(-)